MKKPSLNQTMKIFLSISAVGIAIGVAGTLLKINNLIIAGIIIIAIALLFQFIFYRCPYCGKFLGRRRGGVNCPYCKRRVH